MHQEECDGYARCCKEMSPLWGFTPSPTLPTSWSPIRGSGDGNRVGNDGEEGALMRLITRFATAISSLMAVLLAGGAHWKS